MKIKWMEHASFLIETRDKKILIDPFDKSVGITPDFPPVDIVLISHDHFDHNAIEEVPSYKEVIKGTGERKFDGISIKGIEGYHDHYEGKLRGKITMFKISSEGISVLHLSDIGAPLSEKQLKEIGKVDVVMIPTGGIYTVEPEEAWQIINQLAPKIVIPMHYQLPFLRIKLLPVSKFLEERDYIEKKQLDITAQNLPEKMQIVLLKRYQQENAFSKNAQR